MRKKRRTRSRAGLGAPWRSGFLVAAGALLAPWALACTPPPPRKPLEMEHIGTVRNEPRTPVDEDVDSGVTSPNSATPLPGRESACATGEIDDLAEALKRCESTMPRASELPTGLKDKLEVKVNAGTVSITPGGRVDLTVILRNKSSDTLPLFFSGDPAPRFDVEAVDARGKRVDLPPGKAPKVPARDAKGYRVTLSAGGTARLRLSWDAVKTKWAPERAKTWEGRGPPRAPAGNLPAGKYTLRIVIPLIGAFEKGELDVPKVSIEVGT